MTVETRGERMLALRRARIAASPPFLRGGFRPFFFLGAAWAAVALTLWMVALNDGIQPPSAFDALTWHRHEMLFGFVGAIVAGFLLTAIPNWTGRLPIAGWPLAALAALWASARLAVLFSASAGIAVAAILDVGFFFVLAALAGREVLAAKNRNLPVVVMVLLIGVADALDHAGAAALLPDADIGIRAVIAIVVMMISLIGGRLVPSFTRNWLMKQGLKQNLPGQPTRFDLTVLAASATALLAWTAAPDWPWTGWLLIGAGCAQALRLARWGGMRSVREPIVLILHVGYSWVPIGLLLLGGSILSPSIPRSAAIHALTGGAMATMILAVMTRAILGHTGRELKAGAGTVVLYALVTLGALLRVGTPLGLLQPAIGMMIAAIAWAGAFLLFLAVYGPILFRPRLGED
ncbi:MAG TPA: NnrS family protein [Allosphingosinicella sp.]